MKVKLLRYTKGGVELVSKSARVSGVPDSLSDREIVRMIVNNDYSSALEHISFSFDISEISVALSRELLEHRISSHTARSTRYNEERDFKYYLPEELAATKNKRALKVFKDAMESANRSFKALRSEGFSREAARYVLPMSLHTNYILTINARSLINFLGLRLCVRASPEIRELAKKIHRIVVELYPEIFENINCRAWNLGACPENEVRDKISCPWKKRIPTKKEILSVASAQASRSC